jgi:hypothetical protein
MITINNIYTAANTTWNSLNRFTALPDAVPESKGLTDCVHNDDVFDFNYYLNSGESNKNDAKTGLLYNK